MSKKLQATPESVTETDPPAPAVEKKEKAPAGPKAPKGTELNSVIHFLKDKDGKSYGPDHNPKRPGTAGHQRFALYTDGMTVSEALAAGIWGADISWDLGKGFISVTGGTPAAASPTEQVSSENGAGSEEDLAETEAA